MNENPHLMALRMAAEGFQSFSTGPTETDLHQISERAWLWQWFHYSSLVLRTKEGLAVIDPANRQASSLLRERLSKEFPGEKVGTLLYSHEHLDHASGGGVFAPKTVIGHRKVGEYLRDYPNHDVVPPTVELDDGDSELEIGGIGIRMHHVPGAHTDSLFGIEIPSERILYVADLAAVKALPFVLQNLMVPETIRAIDRLLEVDFDIFAPAHFQEGTKEDLRASATLLRDLRSASARALAQTGLSTNADVLYSLYEQVYNELTPKYGDWHGFGEQIHMFVMRALFGEVIGY